MIIQKEIYIGTWYWSVGDPDQIVVFGHKPTDPDFILYARHTLHLDVPIPSKTEVSLQRIAALEMKADKIRADTQVALDQINEQIQSLRAIEA